MSFRIRLVNAVDPAVWAVIAALDAQCFTRDMADALGSNEGVWWIAYAGRDPVGYLALVEKRQGIGDVIRVGVIPGYRGNGLQKQMLRRALDYARRHDFKQIVTYVANWNLASANSFIACGFRLFEPKEKWGFDDALYFKKELK